MRIIQSNTLFLDLFIVSKLNLDREIQRRKCSVAERMNNEYPAGNKCRIKGVYYSEVDKT